jgi:uncharacterized protein YjbI with pentapeptide repeats
MLRFLLKFSTGAAMIDRIRFWWRSLVRGVNWLNGAAGWLGLVVVILGIAAGIAVPLVFHVSHWLTAVVLISLLAVSVLEGSYDEWKKVNDRWTDAQKAFISRQDSIAAQLGDDKPPVRLQGIRGLARLADEWQDNRQESINSLCQFLKTMPCEPDPGEDAPSAQRAAFKANREVRHTVIGVIAEHLRSGAPTTWQGLNFDFSGVVFDGGDFSGAEFSGGTVNFTSAEFKCGTVDFSRAAFSGGTVNFDDAKFTGRVNFDKAEFSGSHVSFCRAEFSDGTVSFTSLSVYDPRSVRFTRGTVDFGRANFTGSKVDFSGAEFSGATVSFFGAKFAEREVSFCSAEFKSGTVDFRRAGFFRTRRESKEISFLPDRESNETICNTVSFDYARFTGGTVDFSQNLRFAAVDFRGVRISDWINPPQFDSGAPVMLPAESGEAPS